MFFANDFCKFEKQNIYSSDSYFFYSGASSANYDDASMVFFKIDCFSFKIHNRVFLKVYDSGNIGNKGLHREEQNKFSKKVNTSGD